MNRITKIAAIFALLAASFAANARVPSADELDYCAARTSMAHTVMKARHVQDSFAETMEFLTDKKDPKNRDDSEEMRGVRKTIINLILEAYKEPAISIENDAAIERSAKRFADSESRWCIIAITSDDL